MDTDVHMAFGHIMLACGVVKGCVVKGTFRVMGPPLFQGWLLKNFAFAFSKAHKTLLC